MKGRKKRFSIRRCVAFICLASCGLFFVGKGLAKMTVDEPVVAQDGAVSVAGWSVDLSSTDEDSMTLDAGSDSQSYSLTVTNNSDVVSTYGIKISNIPEGIKIGLDIESDADLMTPTDGVLVFTNTGGDLAFESPNNTRTHVLTLAADAEANITDEDVDLSIEVLFEQKDPRL